MATALACSISGVRQKATTIQETANMIKTEVGGVVAAGGSILKTAAALGTQHPGILATVQAVATQGAPLLSTIEAVSTNNPSLVQTAQSIIHQEIPTGEPAGDIPILNRDQLHDYFGSSRYIFYTSSNQYSDVLQFYQTEMANNGWHFNQNASHEYSNAAQLVYDKDIRTATVNLSLNPLNNTTVVVITISSQ
jgi:hypothetical protein